VGRVVGSVCVVAAKRGELKRHVSLLGIPSQLRAPGNGWVAKTVIEPLIHTGDKFVLNILQRCLRRHFLKPFAPGEDRFTGLNIQSAENGCYILSDALAYLECTVETG